MTKERNAFKAGLFILITILLIVGIVVSIKGVGRFTERGSGGRSASG